MKLLAIDTSSTQCSVAVIKDGLILNSSAEDSNYKHSTALATMAKGALIDSGIELADIDGIAVAIGPGSLTGLRVGLAFAKGLCMAASLKIVAVPTLDAMSRAVKGEHSYVMPIIRAKKGFLHTALYENGKLKEIEPYKLTADENLSTEIFSKTILVGDDAVIESVSQFTNAYEIMKSSSLHPVAEGVALIGEEMLKRGKSSELSNLEPDYKMEFKAVKWIPEAISI